ncbi:MAG: DUF3160 domain-containing protein, partial [Polyangiales bacterium]
KPTQAATPVIAGNCSTFELPEVEAPWSTAYPLQSGTGCTVADDNIEAARTSALASLGAPGAKIDAAWDHKSDPLRLELVTKRLGLTKAEIQAIRDRGFAVLGKQSFGTYAEALHEVYQSELPLWVSTDAILHAVYRSNDTLIKRVELASLRPRLGKLLESMHCALGKMALPAEVARDADVYLTVARSLLAGTKVASVFGNASSVSGEVERLVARATAAEGIEDTQLFGRKRMVDFSVYKPRGHYDGELANYFRAASWLSRLELNLVTFDCASSSKGDPSQTPREVALAIALADLAEKSGSSELAALEQAWSLFAGKREDVPFGEIAKVGLDPVPASAERLRAAIGRRFPRTARTHFTWEGCGDLPAITTMLGARVVPDSAVTRPLVHSEVTGRQRLGIADMAYAFGLDRAKTHLAKDLADYPTLGGQLEKARTLARAKLTGEDLYSAWFSAVRAIADRPQGTLPSFMHGEAYDDLRFNSLTAGFGQIRHNYVLFAAMTYGEAGCAIPDAFVEPQVQVYDALVDYATRGEKTMHLLAMDEESGYFQRLGKNLKVLRAISARELEGKPLPDEAIRFLSMVVEITFGTRTTGSSPTFTGWYFDMFRSRDEGLDGASFLADYYTSSELSEAAYAGVSGVDIGVFVVDVGGAPRVMVGPVSHAFE